MTARRSQLSRSILRTEILSQPKVLQKILSREQKRIDAVARRIRAFDPRVVLIVARGSADNAGRYAKYLFGAHNGLVVSMATPSLITRYGQVPSMDRVLVLAISQSGESFDVVETVERTRAAGALTVAVTNTSTSPLAATAEEVLLCHAGPERSVAATKTYTAQLLVLAALSAAVTGRAKLRAALDVVPDAVASSLEVEQSAAAVAERLRYLDQCAVVGRGFCYGTAFEVALKLAELTYVVTQPFSSADFRHGPMAVVDRGFCVILLAPKGKVLGDVKELLVDLGELDAEVVAISDVKSVLSSATRGLAVPPVVEWLSPLTCVIPGQLLAAHLCEAKGLPVDRPRGLRKVTRTL